MKVIISGNLYTSKYDDFKNKFKDYTEKNRYTYVYNCNLNNYHIRKSINTKNKPNFTLNFCFNNKIGLHNLFIDVLESTERFKDFNDFPNYIKLEQINDKGDQWSLNIDGYDYDNCKIDFCAAVISLSEFDACNDESYYEEILYRPVNMDDLE